MNTKEMKRFVGKELKMTIDQAKVVESMQKGDELLNYHFGTSKDNFELTGAWSKHDKVSSKIVESLKNRGLIKVKFSSDRVDGLMLTPRGELGKVIRKIR